MCINSNLDVQQTSQSAGVSAASTTTSAKSTGSQNTVFEKQQSMSKKIKLNEEEIAYLSSKGYNISELSDKEIQQLLEPFKAEQLAKSPDGKNPEGHQTSAVPEKSAKFSVTEVKINYNDKNLKTMDFTPEESGVYACDFYKLDEKDQSDFFVKNFAKKYFGEKWATMSAEAKAQAIEALEADFTKNIPSWKNMKTEDKGKLALAFFAVSDDVETKDLRFDGDMEKNYSATTKKPLNEQIENTIQQIITKRENKTRFIDEEFNKEMIEKFGTDPKDCYDKQLNYLEKKVQQGGEESLSKSELNRYKLLSYAAKTGVPFDKVFGTLNSDKESSTFAIMQKNEHYQEIKEQRTEQIYNNINDRDKSEQQATREAARDWFIHQFEGIDPKDTDALTKKYLELRDNCSTPEEQLMLLGLARKVQGLAKVNDNLDAIYHSYTASENPTEAIAAANDIAHAHHAGKVDEEIIVGLQRSVPVSVPKEARAAVSITYNRASKAAAKVFVDEKQIKQYSAEEQEQIFNDAIDNAGEYKDKDTKNILAENIGHTDDTVELKVEKKYSKHAVESQDTDLMQSVTKGVSKYSKSNQVKVTEDVMASSRSFKDEDAIAIQTTLSDQISKCHKDNQLAMHEQVMQSEYSEVQERAAANIKDYDPSVQSRAIDTVYETKNEKAIKAVVKNLEKMPPQVQQTEVYRLVGELALNNAIQNSEFDTKILGGSLTNREIAKLTASQRRDYFVKMFEEASPAKKLEMLKGLASNSIGVHKKTIYTIIARFSSVLLKSMVESGMGQSMLEAGLPLDAVNKIINVMKTSTNNEVIEQLKDLKKDSHFEKYFADTDKKNGKSTATTPSELKGVFAARIDNQTRKKLKEQDATMYIQS